MLSGNPVDIFRAGTSVDETARNREGLAPSLVGSARGDFEKRQAALVANTKNGKVSGYSIVFILIRLTGQEFGRCECERPLHCTLFFGAGSR